MKLLKQIVVLALAGSVGLLTTACQDMESGANSSTQAANETALPEDIDLESLNSDLDDMEAQFIETQKELLRVSLADALSDRVNSSGAADKVDKVLRRVFEGLLSAVDRVQGKIDDMRAKVHERMLKLDPLNPLHIQLAMKLQEVLDYLDRLEDSLDQAVDRLVVSIDEKVADIDASVAKLDMDKPLSWVAYLFWQKIRGTIIEYRDQLAAR